MFLQARRKQLALFVAKLREAGGTSALLCGFSLMAMVEVQLPEDVVDIYKFHGDAEIVLFSVVTFLLVGVHLFSVMVSTSILPYLESAMEEVDDFLASLSRAERQHLEFEGPAMRKQSIIFTDDDSDLSVRYKIISERLDSLQYFSPYVSAAWMFANGIGIALFLFDLTLLSYIKFIAHTEWAGWAAIIAIVPATIIFSMFSLQFYRKIVLAESTALQSTADKMNEAEDCLKIDRLQSEILSSRASTITLDNYSGHHLDVPMPKFYQRRRLSAVTVDSDNDTDGEDEFQDALSEPLNDGQFKMNVALQKNSPRKNSHRQPQPQSQQSQFVHLTVKDKILFKRDGQASYTDFIVDNNTNDVTV
eukprot:m.48946 g.48946  ORF g.48946 m.48946 type:complete len:362 (-) comp7425_c0_seq3:1940-3025(-)